MQTGRRTFFKKLGSALAGLTVAGRLKAQEAKLANTYQRKYMETALSGKTQAFGSGCSGVFVCSGRYISNITITGSCPTIKYDIREWPPQ